MVSRFTRLVLELKSMGFSIEDIDEVVENRAEMLREMRDTADIIEGANALEDEIERIYEEYMEYEEPIFAKYETSRLSE